MTCGYREIPKSHIYCWLTYRLSYLRKPTEIPWAVLQIQFGADYARTRGFKESFLHHLHAILTVYPEANVKGDKRGLLLKPSCSAVHYTHRLTD